MNDRETILETVHDQYAAVARSGLTNDSAAVRGVAAAFGYSDDELASLPPEANMGLSCGNPVAIASLKPGEVVVDLGCGGGLDVLLAARQVGPAGKAIGIDMTADMLERARAGTAKVGATNVEFHQAEIDNLPLADNSVDCIVSNCVINLVPDKDKVFREMLRVLKPGGRLAISDIALHQPLPEEIRPSIEAYVGCIAGALLIDDYRQRLQRVGFEHVTVTDTGADLNAYTQIDGGGGCCGTIDSPAANQSVSCCGTGQGARESLHTQLSEVLSQFDANRYAASVRVHAVKLSARPGASQKPTVSPFAIHDEPATSTCCGSDCCSEQKK